MISGSHPRLTPQPPTQHRCFFSLFSDRVPVSFSAVGLRLPSSRWRVGATIRCMRLEFLSIPSVASLEFCPVQTLSWGKGRLIPFAHASQLHVQLISGEFVSIGRRCRGTGNLYPSRGSSSAELMVSAWSFSKWSKKLMTQIRLAKSPLLTFEPLSHFTSSHRFFGFSTFKCWILDS